MAITAVIPALGCLLGSMTLAATQPSSPPLVDRAQVEAAGLTIYWQGTVSLQPSERVGRLARLDENVYLITDQGRVIVLDAATGVARWSAKLASPGVRIEGPTHGPDDVYFVTVLGVQAMDRRTGEVRMKWRESFTPTGPVASDGRRIYGGNANRRVVAVRPNDKQLIWQFMTDGLVVSAPVLLGPSLFVVSESGVIYGADKDDKMQLWPPVQVGPVRAAPAARENRLFVASVDHSLYCIDLVTGQQAWRLRTPAALHAAPKAAGAGVYQPIAQYGLFCIDAQTGKTRWTQADGADLLAEHAETVWLISPRMCLLGCDKASGQTRREIPTAADLYVSNPDDDAIFLATTGATVVCIRPAGAGFLRYRTVLEAQYGATSQPAGQELLPAPAPAPAPDYLRASDALPPIGGNGGGTAATQPAGE